MPDTMYMGDIDDGARLTETVGGILLTEDLPKKSKKTATFGRNLLALAIIALMVAAVVYAIAWIAPFIQELPRPGETLAAGGILFVTGFLFYPLLERILNKKK